jgi:hypothetical protein
LIADGGVVVCPSPSCDGFTPMFECPLGKCASCASFRGKKCGGISEELQKQRDGGGEVGVDIELRSSQKLSGVVTFDSSDIETIWQCLKYGAAGYSEHIKDDNGAASRLEAVERVERKIAQVIWEIGGAAGASKDRVVELEAALGEAIESIESWGAYASEYFREKHDLAGDITKFRDVLQKGSAKA